MNNSEWQTLYRNSLKELCNHDLIAEMNMHYRIMLMKNDSNINTNDSEYVLYIFCRQELYNRLVDYER